MRRRQFIRFVGGAVAAWPLASRAQQAAMPVIGFVNPASARNYTPQVTAFLKGLAETGYVETRNVAIEYRWGDGQNDRLPALVADLVHRQVAVIVATATPAALAAKAATTTIPIVFEGGMDPVGVGLVPSLDRPGGNITGVTQLNLEVSPKRLELLHELVPNAKVIAFLNNPDLGASVKGETADVQAAARKLGVELHVLSANTDRDFDAVFAKLVELRAGGLVIGSSVFFVARQEQLAALTVRYAMPAVFENRQFVAAGGLMSYGGSLPDAYRLAGIYAGRVLKGEKPGDLPVQRGTKIELYINLKSARALGLSVPPALQARADEMIE
jgi:putative tryptophan/tyrosine transport system substrate-binding protein